MTEAVCDSGVLLFCKDFGGVPGEVDNSTSFAAAMASGKPVYFEPGSYMVQSFGHSPAENTRIIGAGVGHSEINFSAQDTTPVHALSLVNRGASFENIKVRVSGPTGATVQVFSLRANDLTFDHVEVDGGNTSSNPNVVNAFNFGDANVDNLRVLNCDIHNVQRVNLRTNTNTGIATNLLYQGNRFRNMGQGGLQFNFPLGSISGLRVIGNFFRDFHAGTEKIYTGGASLTNATFANNLFMGAANECIHLEEGGDNISITGNVFAANAKALTLGDNDVGGTFKTPSRITVTGNTFIDASLTRANVAIDAPDNSTGIRSYAGLIIDSNAFRGYDVAINVEGGSQSVRGNYIANCDKGVRSRKLGPWCAGNTFDNVSTAVCGVACAGLVGKNTFINPITLASSEDGSRVSMSGFCVDITSDISVAASAYTNVNTGIPTTSGNRMWGTLRLVAGFSAANHYRHRAGEVTWDGTTLTDTEKVSVGSGSVALSGLVNNSNVLAARFNNTGAAVTLRHLAVDFDGIWTSSA